MLGLCLTCSGLHTTPVPQTELPPSCQTGLLTAFWNKLYHLSSCWSARGWLLGRTSTWDFLAGRPLFILPHGFTSSRTQAFKSQLLSLTSSLLGTVLLSLEGNHFFFPIYCLTCESLRQLSPANLPSLQPSTTPPVLLLPYYTFWTFELASLILLPDLHLPALHAKPLSSQKVALPVIPAVRMQRSGTRLFSEPSGH